MGTACHFKKNYEKELAERIFTPAIAYLILPAQVPYAQENCYEAALSCKENAGKEKAEIKGLYIVSPFYQETDQTIITHFKSLGGRSS